MAHCIVLVKQVPDVSRITDSAFDPETGNLMRNQLPSVLNDLDDQALAFAARMRDLDGGGRIVALTMGPPAAEDVLRHAVARGADDAVLLTDRKLGGADTYATACPLAAAIRKIVAESGAPDARWYVVAGMQSVDGDTAQVPPQIAEDLGVPCVTYATDVASGAHGLEFTRIVSGGMEVVVPLRHPCVLTVAKYEYRLFPTVAGTRHARRFQVRRWSADDVKPRIMGGAGSKTNVVKVFTAPPSSRRREAIPDAPAFARRLVEAFREADPSATAGEEVRSYQLPARRASRLDRSFEVTDKQARPFQDLAARLEAEGVTDPAQVDDAVKARLAAAGMKGVDPLLEGFRAVRPRYEGEVWVMAEVEDGQVHPATFELLGKARDLADVLETRVGVVLAGTDVERLAPSLIEGGADDVHVADDPGLAHFDALVYRRIVAEVVERSWPQILLFAATPQGRTLAPLVSYRLHCGLTADCTGLDIRDNSRKGEVGILVQTRPALGGNVMAMICTKDSRCQMATARPGVLKRRPPDPARTGRVLRAPVEIRPEDVSVRLVRAERGHHGADLHTPVIVSGGRGLQTREAWESLVGSLAGALSKRLEAPVGKGASRAAVEMGFVSRDHQVGQTGTAVGPRVYVALGISGAIQHMIGVAASGRVFAINSDPHAAILSQCDHYLVGDAARVVPDVIRALEGEIR